MKVFVGCVSPEGAHVRVEELRGDARLLRVWSLRHLVHHSPAGFEWGHGGSEPAHMAGDGPADLALAMCAEVWPRMFGEEGVTLYRGSIVSKQAWDAHQEVKRILVSGLPVGFEWRLTEQQIRECHPIHTEEEPCPNPTPEMS